MKRIIDIAVIGIACRFPGAKNPGQFWSLLEDAKDLIQEVPADRFDINAFLDPTPGTPGKLISKFGGFIDNVDQFDSEFFGMSATEADRADPQQRLALMTSWEALEDAGLTPSLISHLRTGVYVGMHGSDYEEILNRQLADTDLFSSAGAARSAAAGRISYALNLEGPSIVIDSDRSSSLVAIHMAARALQSAECDLAIAGGTNLILSPDKSIPFSRAQMLAPDGRCKFGDVSANGFVRSDGIGFVVLKSLEAAVRDKDQIYCVIKGGAVLHGKGNHLLDPSIQGQKKLLAAAWKNANISPDQLVYIEAHGTGTPVGDKAELTAIGDSIKGQRTSTLLLGSVKSNIGHTESAAGVAGVIKLALMIKNGLIPRSLHYREPSPAVDHKKLHLEIVDKAISLSEIKRPFIAGVSSFGLTGTNAHLVITTPPAREPSENIESSEDDAYVLPISSHHEAGLQSLAEEYSRLLRESPDSIRDIIFTASCRRTHQNHRLAIAGRSKDEIAKGLESFLAGEHSRYVSFGSSNASSNEKRRIAFVFAGHGSQWLGMASMLYRTNKTFKQIIDLCDSSTRGYLDISIVETLLGAASEAELEDTIQPTLTAVGIGLAHIWLSTGIKPDVVVGSSMGEIAAAVVSDRLSIEDAMKIVCLRTRLIDRLEDRGQMLAVGLSEADTLNWIQDDAQLSLSVINGPKACVVSGAEAAVDQLRRKLDEAGVFCRQVKIKYGSHSQMMDPVLEELRSGLMNLTPKKGTIPFFSTVFNRYMREDELLDGDYWVNNLRSPVLFQSAIQQQIADGTTQYIEISPHPILSGAISDCLLAETSHATVIPSTVRNRHETLEMIASLGAAYTGGLDPNWNLISPQGKVVSLPLCAWKTESHWFEPTNAVTEQKNRTRKTKRNSDEQPGKSTASSFGGRGKLKAELDALALSARPNHFRKFMIDILCKFIPALDIAALESDSKTFKDLGATSVISVEIRNQLNLALDLQLPASLLFDYPNLSALSAFILGSKHSSAAKYANIGEILLKSDTITEQQLADAVTTQKKTAKQERLGTIMVKKGFITPDQLTRALNEQMTVPIAIIGASCRFPGGVNNINDYWEFLASRGSGIIEVPPERWSLSKFFDQDYEAEGKMHSRFGGFIKGVDLFDANFFGITEREAVAMDPQHRIVLEATWQALENAAVEFEALPGSRVGVYLGAMNTNDYSELKSLLANTEEIHPYDSTGNALSILAGRIAYFLGTQGPAMTLDTACSSSLVAIHMACQSLKVGETNMAIAGGINAILSPTTSIAFSKAKMLSPDGLCRAFDATANGYVRGEGCGIVILKRLTDAISDKDRILGVINGSAINHDGFSNGLTAPNGQAQEAVIRDALSNAGLTPSDIDYVEAHGTGTPLGDPIEARALGSTYGSNRPKDSPLLMGSVKSNIGHLEAASGVASVLKLVSAFQHESLPPSLHFKTPNPLIQFDDISLKVVTDLQKWPRRYGRMTGAVSSFGFSGTNAHLIISSAPQTSVATDKVTRKHHLLTLSAKNQASLRELANRYVDLLETNPQISIADVCYTAGFGRRHFGHRWSAAVSTTQEALEELKNWLNNQSSRAVTGQAKSSKNNEIVFVLTNCDFEKIGWLKALRDSQPSFKSYLDLCSESVEKITGTGLNDMVFGNSKNDDSVITPEFRRLANLAIQYSLAKLLMTWGFHPSVIFTNEKSKAIAGSLAGSISVHDAFLISHHIAHADDGDLNSIFKHTELRPLQTQVVSIATGSSLTSNSFVDVQSWARDVEDNSNLEVGVKYIYELGGRDFVEIGGQDFSEQSFSELEGEIHRIQTVSVAQSIWESLLTAVQRLYARGNNINWKGFEKDYPSRTKIDLPVYPFVRERFWIDSPGLRLLQDDRPALKNDGNNINSDPSKQSSLLGQPSHQTEEAIVFEFALSLKSQSYLRDHRIGEHAVVPGAMYLELAAQSAKYIYPDKIVSIVDLVMLSPLQLKEGEPRQVRLTLEHNENSETIFNFQSMLAVESDPSTTWVTHSSGRLESWTEQSSLDSHISVAEGLQTARKEVPLEEFYSRSKELGLEYGLAFQALTQLKISEDVCIGHVTIPSVVNDETEFGIHPIQLDGCIQVCLPVAGMSSGKLSLPFSIERYTQFKEARGSLWCIHRLRNSVNESPPIFDFSIYDATGEWIAEGIGLSMLPAPALYSARSKTIKEEEEIAFHPLPAHHLAWTPLRLLQSEKAQELTASNNWLIFSGHSYGSQRFESAVSERLFEFKSNVKLVNNTQDLIKEIRTGTYDTIVLTHALDLQLESSDIQPLQQEILKPFFELTKTLIDDGLFPSRVVVLTQGAQKVSGSNAHDCRAPLQSLIWGMSRTIDLESPDLSLLRIDLDPDHESERQVELVVEEILSGSLEEQVAYRRGERMVLRLSSSESTSPNNLKKLSGTYIVTGGMGGLGIQIAQRLASLGTDRILLTGRSQPDANTARVTQQIQSTGALCEYISCDVSDFKQAQQLISKANDNRYTLKGIIHAAGLLEDSLIVGLEWDRVEKVLTPKVAGAWHLHLLSQEVSLEHFVLFSSIVSTIGAIGQSNYAAANAFLDALSNHRQGLGLPATTINWGPWSTHGMAASLVERGHFSRFGIEAISAEVGVKYFENALYDERPGIGAFSVDWEKYLPQISAKQKKTTLSQMLQAKIESKMKPSAQKTEWVSRIEQAADHERREIALELVKTVLAKLLRLESPEEVDSQKGFIAMGLDSLGAVEFRNRLKKEIVPYGDKLPATMTFNHPTPDAVVDLVMKDCLSKIPLQTNFSKPPLPTHTPLAPSKSVDKKQAAAPIILQNNDEAKSPTLSPPLKSSKSAGQDDQSSEPIAIVGMSCRFPGGANDISSFWKLLSEGQCAIREVPKDRWDPKKFFSEDPDSVGKTYTTKGGFFNNLSIRDFDHKFFGFSSIEAAATDPQLRMLLEVSWEALEDANINPLKLHGSSTAVYVGSMLYEYIDYVHRAESADLEVYSALNSCVSNLPGRISYFYGLEGPSLHVDAACASSLVSVHLACKSLREGSSNLAMAAGVNLLLTPRQFLNLTRMRAISPTGTSLTFDADANGYVRAEGIGLVVMKRLSDAQRDGDRIYAIVRGSEVIHGGRGSSPTAPNGRTEAKLMKLALKSAGVEPKNVSYVEAHGTGTPLGDPIEFGAIAEVMSRREPGAQPLIVSSVKTNFGHSEGAAGIAGVIKTALALHNKKIPPHVNFKKLNPKIELDSIPAEIPLKLTPWKTAPGTPRIAGINSFGMTGILAHVVMQEAPKAPAIREIEIDRPAHVLPLSAKSVQSLRDIADKYVQHMKINTDQPVANICFTAGTGRAHLDHRLAVSGTSVHELRDKLEKFLHLTNGPAVHQNLEKITSNPKLVMMFSGQGSQYVGMARQLYLSSPTFRHALDECEQLLSRNLDVPLKKIIFEDQSNLIHQTRYTQPCLFAIEYSLFEMWKSFGVIPSAVIGHSVGEFAAACAAGVFGLEDGIKLIAARARLMQGLPGKGEMFAVQMSKADAEQLIAPFSGKVSVAAVNGPQNVVLAGLQEDMREVTEALEKAGNAYKQLQVSHAFHSSQMDPMMDEFNKIATEVRFSSPKMSIYSNLYGRKVSAAEICTPEYWHYHARNPVLFFEGVQALENDGYKNYLEVGPGSTLINMAKSCFSSSKATQFRLVTSLRKDRIDWEQICETIAELYVSGMEIDWKGWDRDYASRTAVKLPTYSFDRSTHWADPKSERVVPDSSGTPKSNIRIDVLEFEGTHFASSIHEGEDVFEFDINLQKYAFLRDHLVFGKPIFPASGFIELILACGQKLFSAKSIRLTDLSIKKALEISMNGSTVLQVVIQRSNQQEASFKIFNRAGSENSWTLNVTGSISPSALSVPKKSDSFAAAKLNCTETISKTSHYNAFSKMGLNYGKQFQTIQEIKTGTGQCLAYLREPQHPDFGTVSFRIHPSVLDGCFQASNSLVGEISHADLTPHLPVAIDEFEFFGSPKSNLICLLKRSSDDEQSSSLRKLDLELADESGVIIASLKGFSVMKTSATAMQKNAKPHGSSVDEWIYKSNWIERANSLMPQVSPQTWAIIGPATDFSLRLMDEAEANGVRCLVIRSASTLKLMLESQAANPVTRIIFAAAPARVKFGMQSNSELMSDVQRSLGGMLELIQNLLESGNTRLPEVMIVTQGAQSHSKDIDTDPRAATLWGFSKSISIEYPELSLACVDLDPALPATSQIAEFVKELSTKSFDNMVMLRDGKRYVAELQKTNLPAESAPITQDGKILITGGLAGLGLQVVTHLVECSIAKNFVLVGRRGPSANAQTTIEQLQAAGAKIEIANLDISNLDELRALIGKIHSVGNPLVGVIHSAGVLDDGSVLTQDWSRYEKVLAPKMLGAWNLHLATSGIKLNFFCMFSSISSLLGNAGQSNYAAANSFMDQLAEYRNQKGLPGVSIHWGPWAETGMAAELVKSGSLAAIGFDAIPVADGMNSLVRIMACKESQIAVAPMNWERYFEFHPKMAHRSFYALMARGSQIKVVSTDPPKTMSSSESSNIRAEPESKAAVALQVSVPKAMPKSEPEMPVLQAVKPTNAPPVAQPSIESLIQILGATPQDARSRTIEVFLREELSKVLSISPDQIEGSRDFMSIGLDSLMAVKFRSQIKKAFGEKLGSKISVSVIFDHPSLVKLSDHLAKEVASGEKIPFVSRAA